MKNKDIKNSIESYWDKRADTYSSRTRSELNSFKERVWLELIKEYTQSMGSMQVLDIGTGPGFFPILLAGVGHNVTGIDCSQEMLEQADKNAFQCGLTANFIKMDCHALDFADNSFDLLICRNLTWTLQDPNFAYHEWYRVLKPNGRLMIFDANWYLRLFDERLRTEYERDLQTSSQAACDNPHLGVDVQESERIAYTLPLSRVLRPQWDVPILRQCGFRHVETDTDISQRVWDTSEQILFRATPLFMICAIK